MSIFSSDCLAGTPIVVVIQVDVYRIREITTVLL